MHNCYTYYMILYTCLALQQKRAKDFKAFFCLIIEIYNTVIWTYIKTGSISYKILKNHKIPIVFKIFI